MRGLFIGDIHIGLRIEELDRTPEILKVLDFAIDYALDEENAIDFVEIGGDTFDTNYPMPEHIAQFMTRLRRLSDGGKLTYVMMGNHEAISAPDRMWALSPCEEANFPGVIFVKTPTLRRVLKKAQVLFLPHITKNTAYANEFKSAQEMLDAKAEQFLNALPEQSKVKVLAVCHHNLPKAKAGTEATMLRQSDLHVPEILQTHPRVAAVINHHIHTPQVVGKITVVGSPISTDFGDCDDSKGFVVGDFNEEKQTWKFSRVQTPQSPLQEFELDLMDFSAERFKKLLKQCTELAMPDAIVKVRVLVSEDNLPSVDEELIKKAFAGCRYMKDIAKVVSRTKRTRDAAQAVKLPPQEAVAVFLEKRKPERVKEKLEIANSFLALEDPVFRSGVVPKSLDFRVENMKKAMGKT